MKRVPVCVDFDGTIVDHRYPHIGQPVPHAIYWMKKWSEVGADLILWTMRSEQTLEEAAKYVHDKGVNLYGVNQNPTQFTWTKSPKAYGAIYVDDAAFGCPLIELPEFARPCVDWSIVGPAVRDRIISILASK